MKIEDLLSLAITPQRPEAKPTAQEGADFAQQLKQALAGDTTATTATQATVSPTQLAAVTPVTQVESTPSEVLDTVLSSLDNYRDALANTNLPLKKLATLVQNLEQDSQRLQSLAQGLPDSSPLKQVMEQAAALAYTESVKFNRGDYV
jgi:hypothetical protein